MNNWKSPVQKYVLTSIISLTLLTAALFLLIYLMNWQSLPMMLLIAYVSCILINQMIFSILFKYAHQKQLEKYTITDSLTGGLNETGFAMAYKHAAAAIQPDSCAVIFIHMQNFRLINENFSINTGNEILKQISHGLNQTISDDEFTARVNGDQFYLFFHEGNQAFIHARLHHLTKTLLSMMPAYIQSYIKLEIGVCVIDDPALPVEIIQARAHAACKFNQGAEYAFYDAVILKQMNREQELNLLFDEAIRNHDFLVYLQPKINLAKQQLGGAEALIRWQIPQAGLLSPAEFMPLFERNGKIRQLDLYMFEQVCIIMRKWILQGKELIPISVNLSRQHFYEADFLYAFDAIAEKYQIPRNFLEFELTESIFLNPDQIHLVKNGILKMHELGFKCSLDDFGSGYSSLGLLKEFEVDALKLDRIFFLDIENKKAKDVIGCLIDLAKKLHVAIVAEGIEDIQQADYLKQLHCDFIQGYVYSKPLPVDEFEQWASVWQANHAASEVHID